MNDSVQLMMEVCMGFSQQRGVQMKTSNTKKVHFEYEDGGPLLYHH